MMITKANVGWTEEIWSLKAETTTTQNLHLLPMEINGYNATSKTDDTTLGFFGKLNTFSNFHPTPST